MKYIELTVTTTSQAEDLVSDIFWNYTDFGVAISSVDDVIRLLKGEVIYDYYDEKVLDGVKGVSLVKGYFAIDKADELILAVRGDLERLKTQSCIPLGSLETVKREVDGDDWIEIWKKHFKPIKIGNVTVCPEWIDCNEEGLIVKINSNLAFGTGEHETTSMIVEEMQKHINSGITVLDVGTGSGILGLIAAKYGAKKVIMTDIDEVAVEVAKGNAVLNNVQNVCDILCQGDLSKIDEKSDLVVANITAEVLTMLASQIALAVKNNGCLILSGILNDRVALIEEVFKNNSCQVVSKRSIGEWTSVVLKKICVS